MKIILMALVLLTAQLSFADECIRTSRIRGYNALDNHTVEIDAGKTDYVMDVSFCDQLKWSHQIAFDTFGSPRVCRGDRLLVLDNFSNHVTQRCFIEKITKVSP